MPRDETEANVWYQFLGTPAEKQSNTYNRVALWHFFPLDIKILKPSSSCNDLLYEEIDFTDITCHDDLGRSSNKVSPPRPLASKKDFESSIFFDMREEDHNYSFYMERLGKRREIILEKRRKQRAKKVSSTENVGYSPSGGRPSGDFGTPLCGSAIVNVCRIYDFGKAMESHGKSCAGCLLARRKSNFSSRGSLSVKMKFATMVETSTACKCCEEKWVHKQCLQETNIEWECIDCA